MNRRIISSDRIIKVKKNSAWINILFLLIGILFLFLSYRFFERELYAKHFQETSCTVLDKKIVASHISAKRKTTKTIYYLSYIVNQTTYREWRSPTLAESYDEFSFTPSPQYNIDTNYSCWYDPSNPKVVILKRGYFTEAWIVFGVALLFISRSTTSLILMRKWNRRN